MPTLKCPYTVRQLGGVCGGDHMCYMSKDEDEKWRVLSQYYQTGLENNEKMLFFQHQTPEELVLQKLEVTIPSIREVAKRGQFQVLYYTEVYMDSAGIFSPEKVCAKLAVLTAQVLAEGYSALRGCGDMSWVYKENNLLNKLLQYESMLNHAFPPHYSGLCLYDLQTFKAPELLQVLTTHPMAIIREKLLQNIYYMPPDEYLHDDLEQITLNRWMQNIEERRNIEEALIDAKTEAERAVHAKASFLATMSHEIRNPTNGIIGSADMLSHTHVTPEQNEYITIIQASAKHLYRVVNDVLDFSKIEDGKLELVMTDIKLTDLLNDSKRLCQYSIQKNLAVNLNCFVDPSCPEIIQGDETRLRQILVNLIGNACKFTEEGEVQVSVVPVKMSTQLEDREEQYLEFSVKDSGMGISQADLSKLFTKFTTIDVTQKWLGSGLGLSICKHLVEAMGGRIFVTSEIGKGSVFYFWIPINAPMPPSTNPLEHAEAAIPISPPITLSPRTASPCPSPEDPPPTASLQVDDPIPISRPNSPRLGGVTSPPPSVSHLAASTSPIAIVSHPPVISPAPPSMSSSPPSVSSSPPSKSSSPLMLPSSPPTVTSPTESPPLNLTSPHNPSLEAYDFSGTHVLVVEDDVINQKILCHMLKRLKCTTTAVPNGLEAIKLVKQHDYSLILTDQCMPECDGYAAVTQIRQYFAGLASSASPATPARKCPVIVVCTGTFEKRLTEVMDDVLIKPVRFQTILQLLQRYCKNLTVPPIPLS